MFTLLSQCVLKIPHEGGHVEINSNSEAFTPLGPDKNQDTKQRTIKGRLAICEKDFSGVISSWRPMEGNQNSDRRKNSGKTNKFRKKSETFWKKSETFRKRKNNHSGKIPIKI